MKELFLSPETTRFSSSLPIIILTRPEGSTQDWQEFDRGPGYFDVPEGHEVRVRLKSINDEDLLALVRELEEFQPLRFLDLAENRNVTNAGLARLRSLPQLSGLNLSSCTITNTGLESLRSLHNLTYLDLSYCNHLEDNALKTLESMRGLTYVSLLGCLRISQGGLARVRRRTLKIYR
jgi:hypothetical protein